MYTYEYQNVCICVNMHVTGTGWYHVFSSLTYLIFLRLKNLNEYLSAYMNVHHMHAWCLQDQKRTLDPVYLELEVSCGFWELNLCPLHEQPVLLTTELLLTPIHIISR